MSTATTPAGEHIRPDRAISRARDRAWARLLVRAAIGDREAFVRFYDATSGCAYHLELRRAQNPAQAQEATRDRYVAAWLRAGQYPGSGLSPLAWLLSLTPTSVCESAATPTAPLDLAPAAAHG